MIKKISEIKDIGRFTSIEQNVDFQIGENQNCNIIYGSNGSGKTTISNILSLFGSTSFVNPTEKDILFNDIKNSNDSCSKITLQGDSITTYPSKNPHNREIYVFNSNFITSHVFNGTNGNIKKFSDTAAEINNPKIKMLNEKITNLLSEQEKLTKENSEIDEINKTITKTYSSEFGSILTDKNKKIQSPDLSKTVIPTKSSHEIDEELIALKQDYELSKKHQELSGDLVELNKLQFNEFVIDIPIIQAVLKKNVQQLSKEVLESRINHIKGLFDDDVYKQSTERWFKFNKSILNKLKDGSVSTCPLCNTDITNKLNSILKDYEDYFDKSYEDFINEIKIQSENINTFLLSLNTIKNNSEKLELFYNKYKNSLENIKFNKFNFSSTEDTLINIKNLLIEKTNDVQSSVILPNNLGERIKTLNEAILSLKTIKDNFYNTLSSKKLDIGKFEDLIRQAFKDKIILDTDKAYEGDTLLKYKSNADRIAFINGNGADSLLFYRNQLSEELKNIKLESKGISKFLGLMGIDNFIVDINKNLDNENIIIKYKSSITEKNRIKNTLSDGEKTALAFSYFLSKIENTCNTEEKIKGAVVIIDDPISSLDANRIYSTAHLINSQFSKFKQLIILSHNFLFLKFFNSFYKGKAKCFILNDNKILDLPDELRNFETPYFYMLKSIVDFVAPTSNDYNNTKKYLPNYIRRVLETFLSFKFAKITHETHLYRTPGLDEFEDNIKSLDGISEDEKKEIIQKIRKVIKVTDMHSHGNAQLTEENFYISEQDLKQISEMAINIINALDKVHISRFQNNQQNGVGTATP